MLAICQTPNEIFQRNNALQAHRAVEAINVLIIYIVLPDVNQFFKFIQSKLDGKFLVK